MDVEGETVGAIGPGLLCAGRESSPATQAVQVARMRERLLGYRVSTMGRGG